MSREGCPAADGHRRQGCWRSDRFRPEQHRGCPVARSRQLFIKPGWLPEREARFTRQGRRRCPTLPRRPVSIHPRLRSTWPFTAPIAPSPPPMRPMAGTDIIRRLRQAGVTRVGIEASGGYERGIIRHLRRHGIVSGWHLCSACSKETLPTLRNELPDKSLPELSLRLVRRQGMHQLLGQTLF